MAVYKQPKSKNWSYKFTWNRQLIRKSTKQTNKRVAEQMEAAYKTSLAKGEVGIREKKSIPTLKDFAPRFEQTIETECADKPPTISFYKAKLRHLLADSALSRLPLDRIDEDVIDDYKRRRTKKISRFNRPLSVASVNRELATLRRLLRMAHEWKILARVPRIRLLRGELGREFVLSYNQEVLYLSAITGDLHNIALLLLDTGLRIGEALSLSTLDVRLQPANGARYGYLTVRPCNSKNSKRRNVPLTSRVAKMLSARCAIGDGGLVFRRPDNRRLSQTWINERHRTARELLNIGAEFVPHSLRHTFGTRLGEAGADAFTIMRLMGHSSVTVSQRYVHPSPEAVENAIGRMQSLGEEKRLGVGMPVGIPTSPIDRRLRQLF